MYPPALPQRLVDPRVVNQALPQRLVDPRVVNQALPQRLVDESAVFAFLLMLSLV